MNHNEIMVVKLNTLVEEFCMQFENPPENFKCRFSMSPTGALLINGISLHCNVVDLIPESLEFDNECLYFMSLDGYEYEIASMWEYEGSPYIQYIKRTEFLYITP